MKKLMLISAVTALSIMLCSCGNPVSDKNNNSANVTTTVSVKSNSGNSPKQTTSAKNDAESGTSATRQTYPIHTEKTGKYDNLSKLSGTYIETINGEKTNYVFVNSLGTSYVKIGTKSPVPIEINTSDKGIMIIRGSKTPIDDYSPYTFNGNTLEYTLSGTKYVWTRIDKLDIRGEYYLIKNNQSTDLWNFITNDQLTVQGSNGTKSYTFKQTNDKLVLTDQNGKTTEYDYVFDEFTIRLTNKNENLYFRAK